MTDDLENLQSRIREAKGEPAENRKPSDDSEGTNTGLKAVADLIITPIVCGGIGMALDEWFGTKPIFFIILAFLGVITGFYNLSKIKSGAGTSVGFKRLQNKEKDANKAQLSGDDSNN